MILSRDAGLRHRPASLGLDTPVHLSLRFGGKSGPRQYFTFIFKYYKILKQRALKRWLHQPVNTLTAIIAQNCQQDIGEAAWCSASQQTRLRLKSSYVTKTQIFQLHHLLKITASGQTQPHCSGSSFLKAYRGDGPISLHDYRKQNLMVSFPVFDFLLFVPNFSWNLLFLFAL